MISATSFRIGVVGASSLLGKELTDTLAESALAACDVVLLDEEDAGQVVAAGDEVTFIQKIEADSFAGIDFVFFAGDAATTSKYWKAARQAGASIVDMTYALEFEPGVVVRGPWTKPVAEAGAVGGALDLNTPAVVAAHPASLTMVLLASRLHAKYPIRTIAATFFEPASEHGRAAMDELHQQTVSLLSFQSLPREQYDAQIAFNLLPTLGEGSKVQLAVTKRRIASHYAALAGEAAPELMLQLVQAPVFHGYVASVLVELEGTATAEQIELAAYGEHIDVVAADSDAPSNISAAGQAEILLQVTSAAANEGASSRFWLWLAGDNLKLASLNAIACATELRRLRPQGKVQ